MGRRADVFAQSPGSVANKVKTTRERKQRFLDQVNKEFSGQGMGPAGKRKK